MAAAGGAAGHADPLRRSGTGAGTAVLAVLLIAAAVFFATNASRSSTEVRPALSRLLDDLHMPAGVVMLEENDIGGLACTDHGGCPGVERWWVATAPPAQLCDDVETAVGSWGAVRMQRLGSAECAFLGVLGAHRLAVAVEPPGREAGRAAPAAQSTVRVALTTR